MKALRLVANMASVRPAFQGVASLRLRPLRNPQQPFASLLAANTAQWKMPSFSMFDQRSMCTGDAPVPKAKMSTTSSQAPGYQPPPAAQTQAQPAAEQNRNIQEDPWTAVEDPKTGGTYYWNQLTNETTEIGASKPTGMYLHGSPGQVPAPQSQNLPVEPWTAVVDKNTGGTYYWNQLTNETTQVGEPKPLGMYRHTGYDNSLQPQSFGSAIWGMFLWGAGISIGFAVVGVIFRMIFG